MGTESMVRRAVRYAALGMTAATVAGGVLVAGAGSTSAPEPANLGMPLGAATGATAAAVYVYSKAPIAVVEWSLSWASGAWLVPGTPCSNSPLPAGATTTKTIQAAAPTSALRKCV